MSRSVLSQSQSSRSLAGSACAGVIVFLLFLSSDLVADAYTAQIIGCVNDIPIHLQEYERLYLAQKSRFQQSLAFDPWQPADPPSLEKRSKALQEARRRAIPAMKQEVLNFENLFEQQKQSRGDPLNTYDLKSYAAENALLIQFFRQEVGLRIQKSLIEKEVLSQAAREIKLSVEPIEIEQRLQSIKSKYTSQAEYAGFLRRNNSTELELRYALEEQLLIDKLRQRLCQPGQDCELIWQEFLAERLQRSEVSFALPGSGQSISICGNTDYQSFTQASQYEPDPIDLNPSSVDEVETKTTVRVKQWLKLPKLKFARP